MDWSLLLSVTFVAAIVQSATGFGFGLIAVSAFLIVLNSIAAVQLVIIITLAMSIPHWFKLKGIAPQTLLNWLSVGCLLGFPLGILAYQFLDLATIKLSIAVLIMLISLQNAWQLKSSIQQRMNRANTAVTQTNTLEKTAVLAVEKYHKGAVMGVGVASGAMASSMAMPGPAVMLYLSRTALSKDEIRATILTFFLFSYGGALLLQTLLVGIELQTWLTAGKLTPAALLGVVVGHWLSRKINQQLFKAVVLTILFFTGLFMLLNL